eukprot:1150367-Pelagomonas_calceolata.AAC.4
MTRALLETKAELTRSTIPALRRIFCHACAFRRNEGGNRKITPCDSKEPNDPNGGHASSPTQNTVASMQHTWG